MTTPRRFERSDARPELLSGRRVAVLGYGNQGHAHALNLRDSGVDVVVGARSGGTGAANAARDGFEVLAPAEASAVADVIMLLVPDEVQARVFTEDVLPRWKDDAVVAFGHGYALAFERVVLPEGRRAFLVAPKGQGHALRTAYRNGGGLPSLIGVAGPDPDDTLALALAYADACGALAGGGFLSSFRAEAVSDQFGEQAVLCGGLVELIVAAWETLVDRGHSPETAYFECVHEVKIIVDLLYTHGIEGMREKISTTAAYGGLRAGRRVIGDASRQAMQDLLDDIESGRFARAFEDDQRDGGASLREAIDREAAHPLVGTGQALRGFLQRCRLDSSSEAESD